jgi:hypothetical protein
MNISRGAYNILFFSVCKYLKVKTFLKNLEERLRYYSLVLKGCCKQWERQKKSKYPKGVMSCFS